jgi:hypothetical protein
VKNALARNSSSLAFVTHEGEGCGSFAEEHGRKLKARPAPARFREIVHVRLVQLMHVALKASIRTPEFRGCPFTGLRPASDARELAEALIDAAVYAEHGR